MFQLFRAIIESGEALAAAKGSQEPLMYEWHDKGYLGAAHGYVGIFCTLLQVSYIRCYVNRFQLPVWINGRTCFSKDN